MTPHILSQVSLAEVAAFFASLASLIGVLWGIAMLLCKRWVTRESAAAVAAVTTVLPSIRQAIERSLVGRDPASYYTHEITFANGYFFRAPMIPNFDSWIAENLTICVVSHNDQGTTLAMKSTGSAFLHPHYHRDTSETIEVRQGTITHMETGRVYHPGETWEIPAGEMHSAVVSPDSFSLVICRPALPTAEQQPVLLTGLEAAFSNHWKNQSHERTRQDH